LAAEPLPHLSGFEFGARQPGSPAPTPAAQADLAVSAEILEEFLNADIVVLGAPMYNLGVSSQLKAWIDRVVIAGKTFRYSERGPEGLAGGKRLIIASSRGGVFSEGAPAAAFDHQESYLRAVFGLVGIRDIEIVRAEGLSVGPKLKMQALKAAEDEIAKLKAA
jgi:FMN-dependent NADH-azoreductase